MRRIFLALLPLLLVSLACSLSGDDDSSATAIPLKTSTPFTRTASPTSNATPTSERTLQATPGQFNPTAVPPATVTNCTPRTDWPLYTVKAGDTLGVIATNTGSTITDLTRANCLANPNSIAVGQQLRVPRVPTGSTTSGSTTSGSTTGSTTSGSTTTGSTTSGSTTGNTTSGSTTGSTTSGSSNAPRLNQGLVAAPVISISATEVIILQPAVSLSVGVVENADEVRFLAGESSQGDAILVGTDVDPFDGASITYTFNEFDSILYFYAEARNEFGSTRTPLLKITYDPDYNPNAGDNDIVRVTPYIGFDGNLYTLQFGGTVTVSWAAAPASATRVDFYYTPNGTTSPTLIGSDTNVADGAGVGWVVPENVLGALSATAIQGSGIIKSSLTSAVYSEGE